MAILGRSHGQLYKIVDKAKEAKLQAAGKIPALRKNLSNHYKNFLNACQGIEPVNSPFEVGAPLSEVFCLGCIGQRFGGTLKYDAEAMKITNHPEANAMLKGPAVREGWDAYDQGKVSKSKIAMVKLPKKVKSAPTKVKLLSMLSRPMKKPLSLRTLSNLLRKDYVYARRKII